jgi:hypothetical protein
MKVLSTRILGKEGHFRPIKDGLAREWGQRNEWSRVATVANQALVLRNWMVGAYIVEFKQNGSGQWKLTLSPAPQLYDLTADPGETTPVRNAPILRKLRGLAVMFQEEMNAVHNR